MAVIQRFAWGALCLLVAGAVACVPEQPHAPDRLTEEEIRLVEETLLLIRVRLETTRDPAAAERMREGLDDLYTDEEREFLLERLADDSARGELVMAALHDSLQAMREVLFPASNP